MNLPEGAIARFGKGRVSDVKFSPDSKLLAVASPTGIWLYDAQTYEEVGLLTGHNGGVNSVVFSPDGQVIAGGGSGDVRLWSVSKNKKL